MDYKAFSFEASRYRVKSIDVNATLREAEYPMVAHADIEDVGGK